MGTVGSLKMSVIDAEKRAMEAGRMVERTHDVTTPSLLSFAPELVRLAAHPIVLQLLRRSMSPKLVCSAMRSVATDARAVRMDLENPTWSVPHSFSMTLTPSRPRGLTFLSRKISHRTPSTCPALVLPSRRRRGVVGSSTALTGRPTQQVLAHSG